MGDPQTPAATQPPEPPDKQRVLRALRLGWALAETYGRLRRGGPLSELTPTRREHALPLGDERSWREQTIETETIVARVAERLGLDFELSELSERYGDGKAASRLAELSRAIHAARKASRSAEIDVRWDEIAELLYHWDARIQDTLAADSFAVASGYQLGRGLAEIYWGLESRAHADDQRSWEFLLGRSRLEQLERLLTRLAAYFEPGTANGIKASLEAWEDVAHDRTIRSSAETLNALHEQLRVWHDVLLVGQVPEARIAPQDMLKRARRLTPVLRSFVPEASLGLLSLASALAAAVLFAVGNESHAIAPVLSVLSFFGVTTAGTGVKAKNAAHSLFAQLRQAMDADLIKQALTLPPAHAYLDLGGGPLEHRRQRQEVRSLMETTAALPSAETTPTEERPPT